MVAECLAVRLGLITAQVLGLNHIIVEGDLVLVEVISFLNDLSDRWPWSVKCIILDCL